MTSPADPVVTIVCSHPADPAIDWSAQGAQECVLEHARRRTADTLAKVPVRDGEALTRVTLRALSHAEMRFLERQKAAGSWSPFDLHESAAGMAIEEIRTGGRVWAPTKRAEGSLSRLDDASAEALWSLLGMTGIEELGAYAMQRARLRDVGPFALPAGGTRGRPPR